jgi:hypothetical protein
MTSFRRNTLQFHTFVGGYGVFRLYKFNFSIFGFENFSVLGIFAFGKEDK